MAVLVHGRDYKLLQVSSCLLLYKANASEFDLGISACHYCLLHVSHIYLMLLWVDIGRYMTDVVIGRYQAWKKQPVTACILADGRPGNGHSGITVAYACEFGHYATAGEHNGHNGAFSYRRLLYRT